MSAIRLTNKVGKMIKTQMTDPATIIFIAVLLSVEAISLFLFFRRHYHNKIKKQQEQFAGYFKQLDEENDRLKRRIAKKT